MNAKLRVLYFKIVLLAVYHRSLPFAFRLISLNGCREISSYLSFEVSIIRYHFAELG